MRSRLLLIAREPESDLLWCFLPNTPYLTLCDTQLKMQSTKVYQKIELREPVMLAAWPGMGNVALGGIDYLRRELEATPFAEIDASQLSAPDAVVVEDGIAKLAKPPRNVFYFKQEPPLVVFQGEGQIGGTAGANLMEAILELAEDLNVQRIYTGAAFPLPMSYQEPSTVFGAANSADLRDSLPEFGVKIMEGGQISGLNGLLLGYAARKGIEAICLLATIPLYAVNFPNPKASKAIVEVLQRILKIELDPTELDAAAEEMEKKLAVIEEKIKDVFPAMDTGEKPPGLEEERVPNYIMEKIERLFQEARVDREKAIILKEELDRWHLYELYEDRFLDLFKKDQ